VESKDKNLPAGSFGNFLECGEDESIPKKEDPYDTSNQGSKRQDIKYQGVGAGSGPTHADE
jgi:hypothetical protein